MSRFRSPLVLLLTGTLALAGLPAFAGQNDRERVIVVLEPGDTPVREVADRLMAEHGGSRGFVYQHALRGFSAELPAAAVAGLARNPEVAYIDPDVPVTVAQDVTQTLPTGVDRVEADLNPGQTSYFDDVTVAVIDTGVWFEEGVSHEDLNLRVVYDCTHIYNIFGVCAGTNYVDEHGHGTHVAGIIGAKDNGLGSLGVAPGAEIYSFKVINADGTGTLSGVIAGVDAVTSRAGDIEVANMSLSVSPAQQSLDDAVSNSIAAGIVYVVAAGNSGADAAGFSPARAGDAITVSALADFDGRAGGLGDPTCRNDVVDDHLATWSNFGSAVDIAAPGVCIYSTWLNDGYAFASGTSMASPMVAGAVARYVAENGRATNRAGVLAIRDALVGASTPQTAACGFAGDPDAFPEPLLFVNGAAFGGTGECTVASSINRPPVAADDAAVTSQDTAITVGILANDTDADGDPLSVASVTQPSNGSATTTGADLTYTPAPGFIGTDSLSYVVTDGRGGSDEAEVQITVGPANDGPVATDDSATTDEDTPVVIDVLANDTDPDGDALSVVSLSEPPKGAASANLDGTITYKPDLDFNGSDTFIYEVSDGLVSTTATVTVDVRAVNDPPIAAFSAICDGLTCDYTDASSDVEGPLSGWQWSFGDGSGSTSQSPSHTYLAAGDYPVTLTVTDGEGATAQASAIVTVVEAVDEVTAQVNPIIFDGRAATVDVWVYRTSDLELVPGATVEGAWTYLDRRARERTKTQSAVTDGLGTVTFQTSFPPNSEVVSFCVTAVTADGYTYFEIEAVSCFHGYLTAAVNRGGTPPS